MKKYLLIMAGLFLTAATFGADWPEWRGPQRNGIVAESPALVDTFGENGPKKLWTSEKIMADAKGGWGSVAIAEGRGYVYSNWRYDVPIETRTLKRPALEGIGWSKEMPEDLREKVETARESPARTALEDKALRSWVKDWIKANVPESLKKFQDASYRRLVDGPKAVPWPVMEKLATIVDKDFANAAAMESWIEANGIDAKWKKQIVSLFPTKVTNAFDKIFCLDTATGKTLWQVELPGSAPADWPCSTTPCISKGRCYVKGSGRKVYCFDAATGNKIWENVSKAKPEATAGSSFVVVEGKAILHEIETVAYDCETGKILWTQEKINGDHSSPVYWHKDGKTYLVVNCAGSTICFDPADGRILWSVEGSGPSTPAIDGDKMAIFSNNPPVGLVGYRLNGEKPEQLWKVPISDRGSSPLIYKGYAYAFGGLEKARGVCVEFETGKVAWDQKLPQTEFSSPIVADGKILVVIGTREKSPFYMIKATPEAYTLMSEAKVGVRCTTPALADGKLFLRMLDSVECYDIKK